MSVAAVILVGGPTSATQFRPLSPDVPQSLFPIAGVPMVLHHVNACARVPAIDEIFLLGDFNQDTFAPFIAEASKECGKKITYLKEGKALGTGGGLLKFRDQILGEHRERCLVLHSDICCTFPLQMMLDFHAERKCWAVVMGTRVAREAAQTYGCYVMEEGTNRMLHYAEHPEAFLSDTINAGIYIFSSPVLSRPITRTPSKALLLFDDATSSSSALYAYSYETNTLLSAPASVQPPLHDSGVLMPRPEVNSTSEAISLERDVLPELVAQKQVYVYTYEGFWRSIKNAGGAVYANEQYLLHYAKHFPERLTKANGTPQQSSESPIEKCEIVGAVMIDPSATVHPTAKIGPNVFIGPNVVIGRGVRVAHSIIPANVTVRDHACILYAIVSHDCTIGAWTRLEGIPEATAATIGGIDARYRRMGITLIGAGVVVQSEVIVRNCIVMSHKEINSNIFNEIIL